MAEPEIGRDRNGVAYKLRQISCPTCELSDTRYVGLRGGEHQRYGLGICSTIVQCRRCGLLYPDPFPIPENPQTLYGDPDKYFENHDTSLRVEKFVRVLREVPRHQGDLRSLLDVGSGRGEMLAAARKENVPRIVGLELSHAMIQHAREQYDVEVLPLTIEQYAEQAPEAFSVVTLNAILEHVYDPNAMIAASRALCRPGGLLYLDIPNEPNLLSRVAHVYNRARGKQTVINLSPTFSPYHVFGFNQRSLTTLLAKHGFEVLALRIFAEPWVRARGGADSVKAVLARQVMRIANLTRTAGNMFVWARRR